MRLSRRALLSLVAISLAATVALGAVGLYRPVASSPAATATGLEGMVLEAGLWLSFFLVLGIFAVAFAAFRREVQIEKARRRLRQDRSEFLRQVRTYELDRRRAARRNN
jgi:hypothetical protein